MSFAEFEKLLPFKWKDVKAESNRKIWSNSELPTRLAFSLCVWLRLRSPTGIHQASVSMWNLFFPLRAIALKSFKWRLTFFLPGCHFNSYSTADTSLLVSVSSAQKKTCEDNLPNSMTMSTVPEHCVLTCCSGHFLSTKILQLVIKRTVITLPGRSASWVIQYHSLCISDTSKHINSQSQPPTKWPLIWFFFGKLKWRGEGSRASQINCPRGKVFMLGRF